jgi:PHP domain
MDQPSVLLLDEAGQWTHRDRHRHHGVGVDVPERTIELRIRLRWGPLELGPDHEENQLSLALFGPDGFRGGALRTRDDQEIVVGESTATPGCLAGPIPSGAWTVNLDSGEILNDGAGTGFLTWRLEVRATIGSPATGPRAEPPIAAGPRPPSGGPRWYRGDLHSHTVHSDGIITVPDRARGAVERGLDFLAITDHNTISQHREVGRWPDGTTPIRGCEVTTFHGHLNCYGLETAIDWRDDARGGGAAAIVEQAHRQHALISINHPNAFGDPWCSGCHWDFARVDYASLDGIEVWNGRWPIPETNNEGALAFWTDLLDAGLRLTGLSGTDSHSAEEDQYLALPMTHVHAGDPSEGSILDGIRRGRVYLSSGPSLSFRATGSDGIERSLPGEQLPADGTLSLSVDVDRLDTLASLRFVTSGSATLVARCDLGRTRVVGERLVATRWWRIELRQGLAANGDLLAITNPVYVSER